MQNLKGKTDSIFKKTHTFISPADLRLIRRFYTSKFKATKKTKNFEANHAKFAELVEEFEVSQLFPLLQKIEVLAKLEPAALVHSYLEKAIWDCVKYPEGRWVPNTMKETQIYLYNSQMRQAREFFKVRQFC